MDRTRHGVVHHAPADLPDHHYEERIYHVLADRGLLGDHGEVVERWSDVPSDLSDHIVIVGYGRHGQRLVEVCEQHDQRYVVIENNFAVLDDMAADCEAYVFGDVIERKTTEKAHMTEARIVISSADSKPVNDHLIRFTDRVDVILRVKDITDAKAYLERGAFYVSVSDLLAADRLEERFEALLSEEYDVEELREEPQDAVDVPREIAQRPED